MGGRDVKGVGIIIQARMGSARLPGKVLRPVGHLPLLGHVLGRLQMLATPISAVVATSTSPQDDILAHWCQRQHIPHFRGSEADVLDRYVQCAEQCGFLHVVRLTGDNPFTDIEELDRLVALHLAEGDDYTHSFGQLPLGVGAEIFTLDALKKSHAESHAPNHREHVNEYIQENPALFRIGVLKVPPKKRAPALRLTVDTEMDLERAAYLAEYARGRWLTTQEAIKLYDRGEIV